MTDEEYLAKAGITDTGSVETTPVEGGTPAAGADTSAAASSGGTLASSQAQSVQSLSAPAGAKGQAPVAKTAAQKAVEMFELAGQKFPVNTKFRIPHGGKILEVPYENLINKYRLSEHLEDKFKKFGDDQKSFAQMKADADAAIAFKQKYGAIQDWSEKNPKDWGVLWDLYQNRQKHLLAAQTGQPFGTSNAAVGMNPAATSNPNLQPVIEKLQEYEQKLGRYDQLAEQITSQQREAQERQDTEFVKNEISEFQKGYPEINLQERDPDGVALWAKIIQWGLANRYTDFAPAAEMYLRQRVHDVIASRARAEALKGIKTQNANGIVKRSSTPFNTSGKEGMPPKDIRKLSYSELAELSKQQLRDAG